MNALEVEKKEDISISRRVGVILADRESRRPSRIMADASGKPPTKFPLLEVGMWRTPWHGDIMIMQSDLEEYVEHNKEGMAVSGNKSLKLPINYGHDQGGKAAGWFSLAIEGATLWAVDVEWTPEGARSLIEGEWKCISAEFFPAGRGGWCDPLDIDRCVDNVIEGAALTNIPLYSNLDPIMASATFGKSDKKPEVFLITASKEPTMPTLEEVKAKDPATLTEDDKKIINENKDSLSAEEKTKFGIETPAPADPAAGEEDPEKGADSVADKDTDAAAVAASIKKGETVGVPAKVWADTQAQLKENKAQIDALREKEITAFVTAHAARGAIKADQIGNMTKRIMADESMKQVLEDLPTNPVLADTQGSDKAAGDATALETELHAKVVADRKAMADKGETAPSYASVRASIIKNDGKFASLGNEAKVGA